MGFMDRLFARHGSQTQVEAVLVGTTRRDPTSDPRPWDGKRNISVVGESTYQEALRRVSGAPGSGEAIPGDEVNRAIVVRLNGTKALVKV